MDHRVDARTVLIERENAIEIVLGESLRREMAIGHRLLQLRDREFVELSRGFVPVLGRPECHCCSRNQQGLERNAHGAEGGCEASGNLCRVTCEIKSDPIPPRLVLDEVVQLR